METCPQYLLLNENKYQLSGFESAKYVCSPPLRAYEDSAALWGALAGGVIDTVATDHCSFDFRGAKQLGKDDFSAIPNGMPGVETRPALMLTFGTQHGLPPELLCRVMAEQPAKLFGLYPRKGIVAEGADADLVVWDPAWRGVISAVAQTQNVELHPLRGIRRVRPCGDCPGQRRDCCKGWALDGYFPGRICAAHALPEIPQGMRIGPWARDGPSDAEKKTARSRCSGRLTFFNKAELSGRADTGAAFPCISLGKMIQSLLKKPYNGGSGFGTENPCDTP